MKNVEIIKYIVLVAGILIFLFMVFVLVNDYFRGEEIPTGSDSLVSQDLEDDEFVSDVFDNTGFGTQFNESDPFDKYCRGNEGSFNSFTICAPN